MSIRRTAWNVLGWISLLLGLLGIVLPLLPTTPFLLLTSACFLRGSPKFYEWLHSHPKLGPVLNDWQRHRSLRAKVKRRAYVFIIISFSVSIFVVPILWVKAMLLVLLCVLLAWFSRIPVLDPVADKEENH
ncbi:YbaN family protein [Vibrio penaeicida]|uniref:YbaN family protein n=1 Tax=Vibrio penaeicida TaxID=104609 RepID=UPI0027359934|nr:YbaN family protein [Vibrio penaeicida]MDP2575557.1 YbaN family protein [Vibrio penaeicida]